jgi:hypothetical protein
MRVDASEGVVRGHLAAERQKVADVGPALGSDTSFEALAKDVFNNYEQVDSSDLTLKSRTFSVPLDWQRSAVAKAVTSAYPVLAEKRASEFATDPFFDFFGATRYLAVPVKVGDTVAAVLTADNGQTDNDIAVEDVSLVYSLAQQAALAVERLWDVADNKRKFRILRKLQQILSNAETDDSLNEGLNLGLSMVCRAIGGSGCFLKDLVRRKTTHIKTVDEYTLEADDTDISVGECFEDILDRTAGGMKPMGGDKTHALLSEVAAETVKFFYATPLVFTGEGLGAMAVYVEAPDGRRRRTRLEPRNRMFFDLCAGLVAERLSVLHKSRLVDRSDTMLGEVQSNLVRERETSRLGARALEYYDRLIAELESLKAVIFSRTPYEKRIAKAKQLLADLGEVVTEYRNDLDTIQSSLRMVSLFAIVERAVTSWRPRVEEVGVDVETQIPAAGPSLLMDEERIETALTSILKTLTACVTDGDRVLIECSTTSDRAVVCIADTGSGLPGSLLSRLFMPFAPAGGAERDDDHRSAMSLAGDILHRHSGEITVKSSPSWKTILVVTFPLAANRDRRNRRDDRRNRRGDRRTPATNRG